MEEITYVGLDAHAQTTAIAVAESGGAAPRFIGTVGAKFAELTKVLGKLGKPGELRVVYEAGPCGFAMVRQLRQAAYHCQVVAPSKIPRKPGDRVKTDRRDALSLAGLARASQLTFVTVPDERDEAMRDLCRARVDAVRARLKARQQLKALLLRHDRRYTGKTSWTAAHERYLADKVSFGHRAQEIAFVEYRRAIGETQARVDLLTQAMSQELEQWRMRPLVQALMTLRGVDELSATSLVAELGEMKRFAHPRDLMGYLGLVPSEYSSGQKRALGSITKTGNGHARRLLIEAAWNYRYPARIGLQLQKRQEGQPAPIRDTAWRAQTRLTYRYRRLTARGLQRNKVCVAIARELAGFIWSIGQQVSIVP
ncbi:MAG TPA: IS110 family transposase [Steroidobacteraceae bacterium]|jgi:transposase|nr:IS110 family transposase [Steroidobacteraceae bacterium]